MGLHVAHQGGLDELADAVGPEDFRGGAGLLDRGADRLHARVAGAEGGVLIGGGDLGLVAVLPGVGDDDAEEIEIGDEGGEAARSWRAAMRGLCSAKCRCWAAMQW